MSNRIISTINSALAYIFIDYQFVKKLVHCFDIVSVFQVVMLCDWRVRLFLACVLVTLYIMIASLISVTRMDAKTLAERRIHSADISSLSGRMFGGQFDRRMMVKRSQERRKPGVPITWCQHLGLKAAPGPVTALASFPGSGNTWLRYLLQQATGNNHGFLCGEFYKIIQYNSHYICGGICRAMETNLFLSNS